MLLLLKVAFGREGCWGCLVFHCVYLLLWLGGFVVLGFVGFVGFLSVCLF